MSNEVWHAADLRDLEIDEASKDGVLVEFDTLHNSILSPSCLVLSTSLPILTLPFSEVAIRQEEKPFFHRSQMFCSNNTLLVQV
jgi:hypothetical protein